VRNLIQGLGELAKERKVAIAHEFQDAVTEVLLKKTSQALAEYDIKTLIISGGVSANAFICLSFEKLLQENHPDVELKIPEKELATDNALMIAFAGYFSWQKNKNGANPDDVRAIGRLSL
jgi:N6-L-threonylcarbamoyladenine synthase